MVNGVAVERHEGTPQGGPLSPLLANVLLDEVDKELEQTRARVRAVRGRLQRVRAVQARSDGRAMESLEGLYAKLRLRSQRVEERGGPAVESEASWATASGEPEDT